MKVLRFIGLRGFAWLSLAVVASFSLALLELGIAITFQILMTFLGLNRTDQIQVLNFKFSLVALDTSYLFLLVAGIAFARALSQWGLHQGVTEGINWINTRLRLISAYEALLHPRQNVISAAENHYRISEVFPKASAFCQYSTFTIAFAVQILILAGYLLLMAWREGSIAIAGLVGIGSAIFFINRKVRLSSKQISIQAKNLTEKIERIVKHSMFIRVVGMQDFEYRSLVKAIMRAHRSTVLVTVLAHVGSMLAPFFGLLLLIGTFLLSAIYFQTAGLVIISFLYIFARFVQLLSNFAKEIGLANSHWHPFLEAVQYFQSFSSEDRARAFHPLANPDQRPQPAPTASKNLPPKIQLEAVSFRYPSQNRPSLSSLTAQIQSGEFVGVVGASGSGKSTLLSLVLGLLEPTSGRIQIDGTPVRDYFRKQGRKIGYVGPEPYLISGSIRANLLYGSKIDSADAQLWEALGEACLSDIIRKLPGGLDYPLSENGDGLSTGQRQRLCLARAFLQKPPLLVLDEFAANLDINTGLQIAENLREFKGKSTLLVTSHRPDILKKADQVISLDLQTGFSFQQNRTIAGGRELEQSP